MLTVAHMEPTQLAVSRVRTEGLSVASSEAAAGQDAGLLPDAVVSFSKFERTKEEQTTNRNESASKLASN